MLMHRFRWLFHLLLIFPRQVGETIEEDTAAEVVTVVEVAMVEVVAVVVVAAVVGRVVEEAGGAVEGDHGEEEDVVITVEIVIARKCTLAENNKTYSLK